ncbi:hypothetical protein ACP4OV_001397 [Aristida adscensionis]
MAERSGDALLAPAGDPGAACRINALSDDILIRAISHLGVRQVVRTCFLSRRWRDLWRSVPRINASVSEFASPRELDHFIDADAECYVLFKKFVNRFMMLRNPIALEEFWLWYLVPNASVNLGADSEDANLWIGHALQCNARSVKVATIHNHLQLDPVVFTSECSLTDLQLFSVDLFPGFFRQLQRACKALERLVLCDCDISDVEISSDTLESLTIDSDCQFTYEEEQASISIPTLNYLSFSTFRRLPLLKNTESLETVHLLVDSYRTQVDDIRQILKSLSGITNLKFNHTGRRLKMKKNLQWCPKFDNLRTLTLSEWCLHPKFYPLIVFLQNSPNLEELTLELRLTGTYQSFTGDLEARSFTCEHLKVVNIIWWDTSEGDAVLNSLEKFLHDSGITSDKIDIELRSSRL